MLQQVLYFQNDSNTFVCTNRLREISLSPTLFFLTENLLIGQETYGHYSIVKKLEKSRFILHLFLDPQLRLEGSYKIGSVLPSVPKFSQNWLISFFLKLRMVLGAHMQLLVTEPDFLEKNPIKQRCPKMVKKWPKNRVFGVFKKIMSLVLPGICVKRKFLWFINILQKQHAWEKSGSQVIAKNYSQPMRFQYSLILNISLIDKYLTLIFGMQISMNERNKAH